MNEELKEMEWKRKRLGLITASELNDLVSASGKIIDGNLDYIRKKRFERKHGFSFPISGKALEAGKENEKYAIAWFRENYPEYPIVYAMELDDIPFWSVDWAKFGASPDAFAEDESYVVEIKCCAGNTTAEFFADEHTDYEEKKVAVMKEHGNQIIGQFLSNEKVQHIVLVKYIYQRDDVDDDTDSPLAPWRGITFTFSREDFDLEAAKQRIIFFDEAIDSDINPKDLKK